MKPNIVQKKEEGRSDPLDFHIYLIRFNFVLNWPTEALETFVLNTLEQFFSNFL